MSKTDEITLKLIDQIKQQKIEISKAERPNWKTSCSFSFTDKTSDAINIHVESKIEKLVNIVAFLLEREHYYDEAKKLLKVETNFKWQGYTLVDWVEDIETRINKIQISSKKKKLESLEARLNSIISPELKAQLELEEISKELEG